MKFEIVTRGRTRGCEGKYTPVFPNLNLRVRGGNCREVAGDNLDGAAKRLELPQSKEAIVKTDTETAI